MLMFTMLEYDNLPKGKSPTNAVFLSPEDCSARPLWDDDPLSETQASVPVDLMLILWEPVRGPVYLAVVGSFGHTIKTKEFIYLYKTGLGCISGL